MFTALGAEEKHRARKITTLIFIGLENEDRFKDKKTKMEEGGQ